MAIERHVKKIEISPSRYRYRILVTGESCVPDTQESKRHQYLFLRWLADNQHLLECGFSIFSRLTISHNGTSWQAEAEAESDESGHQ